MADFISWYKIYTVDSSLHRRLKISLLAGVWGYGTGILIYD